MDYGYEYRPYVSAAKRRQRAAKKIAKLRKSGRVVSPVEIDGRKMARTFWGQSWCDNLEAYSDYANRLPRGRTYARNGSVIDLQIQAGRVRALVSGSSFYDVEIKIRPLAKKRWDAIKTRCAGKIDSMVELLQGSISKSVMAIVTQHGAGLFPSPKEISLSCSCPDWATMCKHVAAALYGVGARLDHQPEMLFMLRGVEPAEMIASAVSDVPRTRKPGRGRLLKADDVSSIFGIELDMGATRPGRNKATKAPAAASRRKKPASGTKRSASATLAPKKPRANREKAVGTKTAAKKTGTAGTKGTAVRKAAAAKRKKTAARKAATKKTS